MASTTFVTDVTVIEADWLNDANTNTFSAANKAAAVLLTPATGLKIFVDGTDGGWFKAVVGAAAATYSDNGGSYCGTQFIPTGGDGSSAWVREYVGSINVKWFGAVGDGSTNDTVAIQAAITATSPGGGVYFQIGTYNISSELVMSDLGVILIGESRYKTTLQQTTTSAKILNISGSYCGVRGLSFKYSATPISGGTAIYIDGSSYPSLNDFVILNAYVGIEITNSVAQKIINFEIFDYESIGIFLHEINDSFISKFIINAGNATRGALGGIRLYNKTEAIIVCDGDILLGVYSMTTGADSYAQNVRPAYNNFTNVFFDSATNGTVIDKIVETEFVGCWFSGGRSGGGISGASVSQSDSIKFTNTRFFNCGSHGCSITATANYTIFNSCSFESNSVTAGVGVAHGLAIAANTDNFTIVACKASNGLFTGTQGYGIIVISGSSDNYIITDNQLQGNATGGLLDAGTGTNKTISGNIGYVTRNKGVGAVIIGQTVKQITHGLSSTPSPEDISITPYSNPTASGIATYYITTITSTTFEIVTDVAVATVDLDFAWTASIKGA